MGTHEMSPSPLPVPPSPVCLLAAALSLQLHNPLTSQCILHSRALCTALQLVHMSASHIDPQENIHRPCITVYGCALPCSWRTTLEQHGKHCVTATMSTTLYGTH